MFAAETGGNSRPVGGGVLFPVATVRRRSSVPPTPTIGHGAIHDEARPSEVPRSSGSSDPVSMENRGDAEVTGVSCVPCGEVRGFRGTMTRSSLCVAYIGLFR